MGDGADNDPLDGESGGRHEDASSASGSRKDARLESLRKMTAKGKKGGVERGSKKKEDEDEAGESVELLEIDELIEDLSPSERPPSAKKPPPRRERASASDARETSPSPTEEAPSPPETTTPVSPLLSSSRNLGLPPLNLGATPAGPTPTELTREATISSVDADGTSEAAEGEMGPATPPQDRAAAKPTETTPLEDDKPPQMESASSSSGRSLPSPGHAAAVSGTRAAEVSAEALTAVAREAAAPPREDASPSAVEGDPEALVAELAGELTNESAPAERSAAAPDGVGVPARNMILGAAGVIVVVLFLVMGTCGDDASEPADAETTGAARDVAAAPVTGGITGTTGTGAEPTGGEPTGGETTGSETTGGETTGGETTGGETTEGETTGAETTGGEAAAAPETTKTRRPRKKRRSKKTTSSTTPTTPPSPSASTPTGGLSAAQAALKAKDYKKAYRLARAIKGGGSSAAYVETVAACGMGDATKAKSAFRRLPLLKRGKAKRTCKRLGVSL